MLDKTRMKDNRDVVCFYLTKHSWKGKFRRIFSIGTYGVSTYNPSTMEATNQWMYEDFLGIAPASKGTVPNEFTIMVRKGRKTDTMRFSSELRGDIITETLRFQSKFGERQEENLRYDAVKIHWSERRVGVRLEVSSCSLLQRDVRGSVVASYDFKDIESVSPMADEPGGFAVVTAPFGRLHMFASERRDQILQQIGERAVRCVGVTVAVSRDPLTRLHCQEQRLGSYSADEHVTSLSEFDVYKVSARHTDRVRRTLCLSESCLLERDPGSYSICTLRPFSHVHALMRSQQQEQLIAVEYTDGQTRQYLSTDRDSLLASLLDSARAAGNMGVHVRCCPTPRGWRLGPLVCAVEEEVESMHLRFLQQSPPSWSISETVARFNANVSYSGLAHAVTGDRLFAENKERLIIATISSLLQKEGDQENLSIDILEAQFHALRRLVASKAGFAAFTQLPGFREQVGLKVVRALKRGNACVTHAAVDMLATLMQPMHPDPDLKQEQLNKTSILSSRTFLEKLMDVWVDHVHQSTGALVVASFLDIITYGLCAPFSETTDGAQFDSLLEMVAQRGRSLYKLFRHPSLAIVKGAGLVLRAVIEEGDAETARRMQQMALTEGAMLTHLRSALFTQSQDGRLLANRQLSRQLIALWSAENNTAVELLERIFPAGLFAYLNSEESAPSADTEHLDLRDNLLLANQQAPRPIANPQLRFVNQQLRSAEKFVEKHVEVALTHWRSHMKYDKSREELIKERPVVLRKRRQGVKTEKNWSVFYYQFNVDHILPHLIWNYKTREELRETLEGEMRNFMADRELSGDIDISWNHTEFEVPYRCLRDEVRIGEYFLRVLLEQDESRQLPEAPMRNAMEFFNDLYHRFLLTNDTNMKCMCLQALSIVYGRHHELIGPFADTKFIVEMLESTTDRLERDRLVIFLSKLTFNRSNTKLILDAGCIRTLCDLITLAHLHLNKAYIPTQSNVIEYGGGDEASEEREWYYKPDDGARNQERQGPFTLSELKALWEDKTLTAKTRCWAQGLDSWCMLQHVAQLRWTLLATGQSALTPTDLTVVVLNMLIRMCQFYPSRDTSGFVIRPMPRIKRSLSSASCLPHIVQLLLTFDPVVVEKVAVLLTEIMLDNPAVSKLFLTGAFFFILMYTGSNLLPIARFLQLTHMSQAHRSEEKTGGELSQRSILGQLLPEAMICYLHNYGPTKFAQTYLGEFDTPEAIWGNEMRKMLIIRISSHLADYSPRLRSNIRAVYQYCPIPLVSYEQLERELFCGRYYLRHLCDSVKFPNWPIEEPVALLKDVLQAWKREVEKKPPNMSMQDALAELGLESGKASDQNVVRKAYFRLAQKYHPDKNPDGREKFEAVNRAYEFICSRSTNTVDGPDPHNIVLILQSQSILFSRFSDELRPYKYAGYPMLVTTIRMETDDEQLFSKPAHLLAAAVEVAYYTVRCSALNAEELRRERGLELLQRAYTRCCSVLSKMSRPDDLAVMVCVHVSRCFTVAAQFQQCRDKLIEMPQIIQDLCRILYYKRLTRLCAFGVDCVSAFALDSILQLHMMQAGVLWHLLQFLFYYDFTMDEGGVEKNEQSNQQEMANTLAKKSLFALARLAGYLSGENETPPNQAIDAALTAMLTPRMVAVLKRCQINELLKLLNINTENPYVIWNNSTRNELRSFLKEQQTDHIRTGESDPNFGAEFSFSLLKDELVVGQIYVRVYNQQPNFPLENAKEFAIYLLEYLRSLSEYVHGLQALCTAPIGNGGEVDDRLQHAKMTLEALAFVIQNNPGVELQCIGHFAMLFGFLRTEQVPDVQRRSLAVIEAVTGNKECVDDMAASGVIAYLLLVIFTLPDKVCRTLDVIHALVSSTAIVKECLSKGAVIYFLDLFCNATHPDVRTKSSELLAKMLSDKLVGPKVRLLLLKFLPPLYMDAMRDSPDSSVQMFETVQENPELIWNDDSRKAVCDCVRSLKTSFFQRQQMDPSTCWRLPDDFSLKVGGAKGELIVSGVYLRLFVANPGWVLRRPQEFLTELMDTLLEMMERRDPSGEILELLSTAAVQLLRVHPALLNSLPAQGHIPRLLAALSSPCPAVVRAALLLTHQLGGSDACTRCVAQTDSVRHLVSALRSRRDMVQVTCETLSRLYTRDVEPLVQQALDAHLVPLLLKLLDDRLPCSSPATVKAHIVMSLKAMSRSVLHGEQVSALLNRSSVWPEFRDQRHDLFISSEPAFSAIAAAPTAGYLTAAETCPVSTPPT